MDLGGRGLRRSHNHVPAYATGRVNVGDAFHKLTAPLCSRSGLAGWWWHDRNSCVVMPVVYPITFQIEVVLDKGYICSKGRKSALVDGRLTYMANLGHGNRDKSVSARSAVVTCEFRNSPFTLKFINEFRSFAGHYGSWWNMLKVPPWASNETVAAFKSG